ncbi:MAG: Crp/Fnr family transcriptional regulator [Gammaproteobacteria bacterium]|nr:Crp/Fnr family transcriptional regulator [Gammaproteobacteria bacterium]MCP5318198.1 Crp/Fnr family transcriptional regulator [Chromatiaceae bacterium]MCW5584961.1 Crp/Fnr family transcriptional regulator [Chromatiales bacterium]MCB1817268.1 Crp/Fnr family transcriptional regulator [Gammaproteobacteria bacterium]MCP5435059.1 Crp/Fnr family transcriptional regulator [Chromatiaceae bacterium]
MLPPKAHLPPAQQRLLKLFRALSPAAQESLVSYAEFLAERDGAATGSSAPQARPAEIERPETESVIAAIRRLSATFHMLDRDDLLHETSALMTAHVMQGKPAVEVIDELEVVFRRHYERVKSPSD